MRLWHYSYSHPTQSKELWEEGCDPWQSPKLHHGHGEQMRPADEEEFSWSDCWLWSISVKTTLLFSADEAGGSWRLLCTPSHMHSQPEATFPPPLPHPPSPSKRNTAWLEEKSGISSRETFFSLQQVSSCSFFLLSFFSLGWVRCLVIHFYLDSFRHFHLGLRWGLGECQAALTLSSCIPWVLRGWRLLMTYSVRYCIHPLLSYVLHTRASEAFRVHLQTWDTVQKGCW